MTTLSIKKDISNAVTVRIWPAEGRRNKLGHASLQTQGCLGNGQGAGIYVSFYPSSSQKHLNFWGTSSKFKTLQEDKKKYGSPSIKETFYFLDVAAIEKEFKSLFQYKWALPASLIISMPLTHNCCTIVLELLKAGKIYDYINSYESFFDSKNRRRLLYGCIASASSFISAFTYNALTAFSAKRESTYSISFQLMTLLGVYVGLTYFSKDIPIDAAVTGKDSIIKIVQAAALFQEKQCKFLEEQSFAYRGT